MAKEIADGEKKNFLDLVEKQKDVLIDLSSGTTQN